MAQTHVSPVRRSRQDIEWVDPQSDPCASEWPIVCKTMQALDL